MYEPNSMTIGSGPYDNESNEPATFNDFLESIIIRKSDLKKTHFFFDLDDYECSFDVDYDKEEEHFNCINLVCFEGQYPLSSVEVDQIKDHIENQLDMIDYTFDMFEELINSLK